MQTKNLSYSFNPKKMDAISQFSVNFPPNGLVSVIGPSGSGKTTLLRLLEGSLTPLSGGKVISHQPCALMRADEELDLSLSPYQLGQKHESRMRDLLHLFHLEDQAHQPLTQLSQGERRRVQLIKALLEAPKTLLLDEPFSGLDPHLTFCIQQSLKKIAIKEGRLIIAATHHIREAMALSDEIFIINNGKLVQRGSPQAIYKYPKNSFVAQLFGHTNLITGIIAQIENFIKIKTNFGILTCPNNYRQKLQKIVLCHFRPEHILGVPYKQMGLSCQIEDIYFYGYQTICKLNYQGHTLYSSQIANPRRNTRVDCSFAYGKGVILDDLNTSKLH